MNKNNKLQAKFQRIYSMTKLYEQHKPSMKKHGRPVVYSTAWIMALVFAQRLLGIKGETTFLKQAPDLLGISSNDLPKQSGYNKRVHRMASEEEDFFKWLLMSQPWWNETKFLLIDSMPVSVKRLARKNSKGKYSWAACGYCASQRMYYFGYKVHHVCTRNGFPVQFLITPAQHHDVKFVAPLLLGQRNKYIIGDKAYAGQALFERLLEGQNVFLFHPPKSNSLDGELTAKGSQWLGWRKQIENFFSLLCRMGLDRPGGKSDKGDIARLTTGINAVALMLVLNIQDKKKLDLEGVMWN